MRGRILFLIVVILVLLFLTGCSSKSDIKDNFCGIHINYQYCKCAFHNQYCTNVGMTKSEAKVFVYEKYNAWIETRSPKPIEDKKYGVFEKDGKLYINSKPGEVLSISTNDLPEWARGQIATIGATITVVGPPDSITTGDKQVLLDGLPIARVNDSTAHGGTIVTGSKNIFVNGRPVAIIGGQAIDPMVTGTVPHVGGPITNNVN